MGGGHAGVVQRRLAHVALLLRHERHTRERKGTNISSPSIGFHRTPGLRILRKNNRWICKWHAHLAYTEQPAVGPGEKGNGYHTPGS